MAEKSERSAKRDNSAGAPEGARAVDAATCETTSDLTGVLKGVLFGVLNDEVPLKKANTVVGVSGKMLKGVELECKVGERSGGKRQALPLQVG